MSNSFYKMRKSHTTNINSDQNKLKEHFTEDQLIPLDPKLYNRQNAAEWRKAC